FKGAPASGFLKAFSLRENMTEAETFLWEKLRDRRFHGLKFRRQHPIHLFVVDFYCHQLKLVIELDGEYHQNPEQKSLDEERTEILKFHNLQVLRFQNDQVLTHIEAVLTEIQKFIPPPFHPLGSGKRKEEE